MTEIMFWLDLIKELSSRLVHSLNKTELVLFFVVVVLLAAKAWILRFIVRILRELSADVKRINGSVRDAKAAADSALSGLTSHEKDDTLVLKGINTRLDGLHTDVREIRDRVWDYPSKSKAGRKGRAK